MKDSPRYPHLENITRFPGTGDPYAQYANNFDYTKWAVGTKLRLFNVPWNDANIVEFETDTKRDEWFDAHAIEEYRLTTVMHLMPDGSIKLPMPFEAVSRCNYLVVNFDVEPVATTGNSRIDTWCYYLHAVEQCAPSTTRAMLELDAWQTFGHHVKIGCMQLEQGHAPMLDTTVSEYLANPVEHNACLLAPDVSYGDPAAITTHSEFHPFGAGDKTILFATTLTRAQLLEIGKNPAPAYDGESTPPTYADNPARWGHQYEVRDYKWRLGEADYTKLNVPVDNYGADTLPTGLHVYGVSAANAYGFFRAIAKNAPQVMQTIQAMWQIGTDMIDVGEIYRLFGFDVFEPTATHELDTAVTLTPEMFAYDKRYANIPKLYTYPYAALTLSDNDGTTCTVRVENCGTLTLHQRVSTIYPYLRAQAFLTGVNGTGGSTYEWRDINGNKTNRTAWNTPFTDFLADYELPLYALWLDGQTEWALHNQRASVETERYKAVNAYHTSMRNVNTGYENSKDNANTALTNTNNSADVTLSNANDAADCAWGNGKRSADATRDNANRDADTALTNANNSADTALANGNASAATAKNNTDASATTAFSNAAASIDTNWQNASTSNNLAKATGNRNVKLNEDNTNRTNTYTATRANLEQQAALANINLAMDYSTEVKNNANEYMDTVGDVGNESAAATGILSGVSTIAGGLAGYDSSTGEGGVGAASSVGSAMVSLASLGVTIAKNNVVREAQKGLNTANLLALSNKNTAYINEFFQSGGIQPTSVARAQAYNAEINKNIRTTQTNNINDTFNMNKLNIDKSRDTSNANNSRTETTSLGNNARTYNTTTANNSRTNTTAKGNAARSNATAHTNIQQSWEVQCGGTNDKDGGNLGRNRALAKNNALRTRDVTKANAARSNATTLNNLLESREASEFANKTALEQTQQVAELAYQQHATDAPVKFGENSGDAVPDVFGYRGVQIRVQTQPKGAIRMAGDHMLRYGYAFEGNWTPERLQVMKHFTFWKCSEIWLTAQSDIMESARTDIRDLFLNGVTVWTTPEEIGAIDIADNI